MLQEEILPFNINRTLFKNSNSIIENSDVKVPDCPTLLSQNVFLVLLRVRDWDGRACKAVHKSYLPDRIIAT